MICNSYFFFLNDIQKCIFMLFSDGLLNLTSGGKYDIVNCRFFLHVFFSYVCVCFYILKKIEKAENR